MKRPALTAVSLLLTALLLVPSAALACGPFFERAVFAPGPHPDFPLDAFAAGDLGILSPEYARSYLAVAYRYSSANPLGEAGQAAVKALWAKRLASGFQTPTEKDPLSVWLDARALVAGTETRPDIYPNRSNSEPGVYFEYVNCTPSSFLTAAETLTERIKANGPSSSLVRAWVTAQDQVFSNCSGAESIPESLAASSPASARADRAYQIASAHFYAGKFETAGGLFREIAKDPSSPWRDLSPLLAARTVIRWATLTGESPNKELLEKAKSELQAILEDPLQKRTHESARRLLSFVNIRLDPVGQVTVKARELQQKGTGPELLATFEEYTYLLDHLPVPAPEPGLLDEMTDWILTFQNSSDEARRRAFTRFAASKSVPWLLAALSKARPADPETPLLIEAGSKVAPGTPPFLMAAFHTARLEAGSGKLREARQRIDQILSSKTLRPGSSARNQFLALRFRVSESFSDALTHALRVPVFTTFDEDGQELEAEHEKKETREPLLDEDGATVFNRTLPLSRWQEAVRFPALPQALRSRLLSSLWVRAVLLENEEIALGAARDLGKAVGELAPSLTEFTSARTTEERQFVAALIILRFPALRPSINSGLARREPIAKIDSYRDNWWCAHTPPATGERPASWLDGTLVNVYPEQNEPAWPFLQKEELEKGRAEFEKLGVLPTAPNYLSGIVIAYGKRNPQDERVAEALHLAVRSTRYGCTDDTTSSLSKAAYQLLHKNYPKSPWAGKTKYFY